MKMVPAQLIWEQGSGGRESAQAWVPVEHLSGAVGGGESLQSRGWASLPALGTGWNLSGDVSSLSPPWYLLSSLLADIRRKLGWRDDSEASSHPKKWNSRLTNRGHLNAFP